MARKRASGEGTLRRRADGRWESAITTGYTADGKPKRKYFYGKTQKEVSIKLKAALAALDAGTYIAPCKMTVAEWLDVWASQ